MKTKILILFLSLLSFAGYSQTDIKANNVKVAQTLTVAGTTNLNGTTNLSKLNLSDSTKLKNVTITGEIDIKKTVPSLKMTTTGNNQTYNVLKLDNGKLYVGNGTGITVEGTGGTNTMYVQGNNGNVGIGTDVPTSKLHVVGNTTITGTLTAGSIVGTVVNPNLSGVNTGDETGATIQSKLGISTLSGSNTGDETTATIKAKLGEGTATLDGYLKGSDFAVFNAKQNALIGTGFVKSTGGVISYDPANYLNLTGGALSGAISATNLSGSNTGDETGATILSKLGISTLSGSNTGDETNATIKTKLGAGNNLTDGYLLASDWTTFNGKQNALSNASGTVSGILTNTDWTTFNGKQNTLSNASGTVSGILTNTDWTTFNGKQPALSGTGFVKSTAGVISYDATNYLPLTGGTLTGAISATNLSGSNTGDETNGSILTKIGTLPIANGGTNATTATAALTNLLPSQTGNVGKSLVTDGSSVSWGSAGGQSVETSGVVQFSANVSTNLSTITSTNTANYGVLLTTASRVVLTGSTVKGTMLVNLTNGTVTISKDGSYGITVTVNIQSAGANGQWGQLVKNNTTILSPSSAYSQASSAGMQLVFTYTGDFVAGDFIDTRLSASSAGTIGVLGYSYNIIQAGSSYFTTMTPADLTTQVTGILPIANGGTGSTTKNFVDITTTQTVAGDKTLSGNTSMAKLSVTGAYSGAILNQAATTYTIGVNDYHVRLTLAGNQTVTLPNAATSTGRFIMLSNPTGYNKVYASSIFGIDQVATTVILAYEVGILLQSDGTNWNKVASSGEKSCTAYKYFFAGAWNTGSIIIGNMEFAFNATALGASTAINARCVGSLNTLSGTQTVQKYSGATYTGANSLNNSYTTTYSLLVPAAAASSVDANYLKLVYYLQDRGGSGNWEITVMNDGSTNVSMKVVYTKP